MRKSLAILTLLVAFFGFVLWHYKSPRPELYEIETPQLRSIAHTVFAAGSIEAKDQVKVGSLATGVVKDLLVKENDEVKEGQLLAVIETGIGDTSVQKAIGDYLSKEQDLYFEIRELDRQKKLYEKKYVSDAAVDQAEKTVKVVEGQVLAAKATWDQAQMQFDNTKIRSPSSGIVTNVGVAKGERVTTDLNATVICEIAPDVSKMVAKLNVDERDIGVMKKGLPVNLTVDAYPDRAFNSVIESVSFSPKKSESGQQREQQPTPYQVFADMDNPQRILHPRMSVSGVIEVASVPSAISVSSRVFLLKPERIALLAKFAGFTAVPLTPKKRQEFSKSHPDENINTVWEIVDHQFVETPVVIGINNGVYYQIKEGLKGGEKLLVNVLDTSELKKL